MVDMNNFFHMTGIILILLQSISIIIYTRKFIFGEKNTENLIKINQIYEMNYDVNISHICIYSNHAYFTAYNESPCYNKTLMEWYIPWLRYHLIENFKNKFKKTDKFEIIKSVEEEPKINNEKNETSEPMNSSPKKNDLKSKNNGGKDSEYFYSILVSLLLLSALGAIWEVFVVIMRRRLDESLNRTTERQCSLADFTINRHLRRESQQRTAFHLQKQASLEIPAKVTQTLIHQSSLDRAFPKVYSEVKSSEKRRNSVPSCPVNNNSQSDISTGRNFPGTSQNTVYGTTKRQSVDITSEDIGSDLRKKSRHFIRRH